jgi:4-amino-4-deoxy-L-arabinose transferase-like glycosyltransferase
LTGWGAATIMRRQSTISGARAVTKPLLWILVGALALRLIGIWFGLPDIYTSDGETSFIAPAIEIVRTGRLHPHFFGHPGSTVIYPFAALIWLLYAVQRAAGVFRSFAEFGAAFAADPTAVFLLLRVWTAVIGTAVVGVTYWVARDVFGRRAALAGAALTAVAPYQHEWSRIARTDIPLTLFALLTTGFSLRALACGGAIPYLLAGGAAGLACASKYPGGIALLAPLVAHLARWRTGRASLLDPAALAAPVGFLLAFFGSSPYLLIDRSTALRDIAAEFESSHLGADRLPGVWNYLWYLYAAIPTALGETVWLVALPAGLIAFRRDTARRLVFGAFALGYMAVIMSGTLRWTNWVIPALPFFAVWAGWGVDRLAARIERSPRPAFGPRWAFLGLVAAVGAWPLAQVAARDYLSLLVDTRAEATAWYAANLPKGAKVAFEHYAGQPPPGIRLDLRGLLGNKPLAEYRAEGYQYLVFSDWMYGRVYAEPHKFRDVVAQYDEMFTHAEVVREFDPRVLGGWVGRRGPTIRVVRIA